MAVALPPALPPQEGAVEQLQQQGSEIGSFSYQDYRVHLLGAQALSNEDLAAAAAQAETLSDVVRNLAALYYSAGYPTAQLTYALSGQDLYVHAGLGQIAEIEGPDEIKPYFEGLVGTNPVSDSALEPRRVLASVHADRAGLELTPALEKREGSDDYRLNLQPLFDGPDPTELRAEFGNPGNRFVGRHFLDLGIRHAIDSGDEFGVSWRSGLTGLNDDGGADDYHEQMLNWNRVTRWGIFGLAGRNIDYSVDVATGNGNVPVSGDIQQAEAAWLYPLSASFHHRWTVNFKVDYTSKELTQLAPSEALAQSQKYGSAEAGTAYATVYALDNGKQLDLDAGLAIRKGLGDDKTADGRTLADLGYLLYRPQAGARYAFSEHWSLRLDLIAQISSDTVPEQSQWLLGGVNNIYAYLPGVVAGDSGGLARLNLDYRNLGEVFGLKLTPRVFVEYGYAKYENPYPGLQSGGTPAIADAGIELTATLGRSLEASIAYAEAFHDKDVDQAVLDDSEADLYFRLTLKL